MPDKLQKLIQLSDQLSQLTVEEAVRCALSLMSDKGAREEMWRANQSMINEGDAVYFRCTPTLYLPSDCPVADLVGQSSATIIIEGAKFIFHGDKGYRFTNQSSCYEEVSHEEMVNAFNCWLRLHTGLAGH